MIRTLARYRILASRVLVVASAVVLLFTRHTWQHGSLTDITFEAFGYTLLVAAAFVRLWCSLYIYGYKRKALVTMGPYSVVRNPLYLGSLLGALGLGLASENLVFGALLLAFFVAYYPWVVLNEERELSDAYGTEYEAYCAAVPRFVPAFSQLREPDQYAIHPLHLRRAFLDSMWFLLALLNPFRGRSIECGMKTPTPMTKSPRAVAREALAVARAALPAYASATSRKDYTQHQLFAVLALKAFLKTDYRGVAQFVADFAELRDDLGLAKAPTTRPCATPSSGC